MPKPIIPWEPYVFPTEIQEELNTRKENISFNYIDAEKEEWKTGDKWKEYKGPRIPWVRFCSNGQGVPETGADQSSIFATGFERFKEGFILYGGKNFYDGYGFSKPTGGPSVIGYVPNKEKGVHVIDNDYNSEYLIHVPSPEIEKVNIMTQKGLYRTVTVEWVCFSRKQLEYMTPYFLVPGISCVVEWGWNHYDSNSLIDLTDETYLKAVYNDQWLLTDKILQSKGNYDAHFGIVKNFEWTIDGNKIKCKTEIVSPSRLLAGLLLESSYEDTTKTDEKRNLDTLKLFMDTVITECKTITKENLSKDVVPENLKPFVKFLSTYYYVPIGILAGVYYGRYPVTPAAPIKPGVIFAKTGLTPQELSPTPVSYDFDKLTPNKYLWIDMLLFIEIINFHLSMLKSPDKMPLYRININDAIIGSHINLISTNGDVCLIPNKYAPKYSCGLYGGGLVPNKNKNTDDDKKLLEICSHPIEMSGELSKEDAQLKATFQQSPGIHRDDLDNIINRLKTSFWGKNDVNVTEFPTITDRARASCENYPRFKCGYLCNIYVNTKFIVDSIPECKTYIDLVKKILDGISSACGNFWEFDIIHTTTTTTTKGLEKNAGNLTIIDRNFNLTGNSNKVYSFSYFEANSLLQNMSFKPTLSDATAIRSMFGPTNNPNNDIKFTNGPNDLLNYHFKDRLRKEKNVSDIVRPDHSAYKATVAALQQIIPKDGSFQVTEADFPDSPKKLNIKRLVLPNAELLSKLLNDGDIENNQRYTGIVKGISCTFTLQGISGIQPFSMFLVRGLPAPYSESNIVFRVIETHDTIEAGKWVTTITAGIMPLREPLKKRLGLSNPKTS